MSLELRPISIKAANRTVLAIHRHHGPVHGALYALAAFQGDALVGVAIVGRPVSRTLDDGLTFEVTRLATDGAPNACSFLYGAAWRSARARGYRRGLTYILAEETGTSLRAAGWVRGPDVPARSWDRPKRPRIDKHPTGPKVRWHVGDWSGL